LRIDAEKWYAGHDAAKLLGVTEPTIKKYLKNGKLRGRQIGPKKKWHVKGAAIKRLRVEWGLDIIQNHKTLRSARLDTN